MNGVDNQSDTRDVSDLITDRLPKDNYFG
ncbi:hypothetical protein MED297_14570 [Reinekea sp. MED297]|uniref:Uncharacterized protein n=1 Tax=Reinekea blandensis MED297 TaxID=314283 RepID=A4BI28_9GAMM|nr:hypothetical protein MED297_14570 [Reinekea sp. MED297] [Reinekea blandensis MED297]